MKNFTPDCLITKNQIVPELCQGTVTYPETLDLRDLVLKTENQRSTPTCAAHAATSVIESINWRKTSSEVNLDPYKLYDYAKTIDGYPGVDGTTLDAVLYGCIHFGWIDAKDSDVVCFNGINSLKKIIHKYGPILTAFDCSESWMDHYGKLVLQGNPGKSCGGHAVTAVGYNTVGLLIQNSWGTEWGKYGFCCLPWDLVEKQFQYCAIIKNCLNDLN